MSKSFQHRREFIRCGGGSVLAMAVSPGTASSVKAVENLPFPPTRQITQGPRHHWFGYYDKLQFDPSERFVLGMQVDFEHRSPTLSDRIRIGRVDLDASDEWQTLGSSRAWCWQQGCMLQWLPGSDTKVLWNDREGDRFVCRILDIATDERRTIPHSIYSVSPDGRYAVTPDFRRIQDVRPGYGYAGLTDPFVDEPAPKDAGIHRVDLVSGEAELIVSLADIAKMGEIPRPAIGVKHYFNHLLVNPDGTRFIFLHRWRYPDGSRLTRLMTANLDGSDVRIIVPNGYASHFIWRDPQHILCQSRNLKGRSQWSNFLFADKYGGEVNVVGADVLDGTGHISYLPGSRFILNDTYPKGTARLQTPHLFDTKTGRRTDLGHFHLPKMYTGEWRIDTHPRVSPSGRWICIDAPNKSDGRQMYLMDIARLIGS